MIKGIPCQKMGTVFQNPAWRYEALRNPEKYNLSKFLNRGQDGAGHLKRFLNRGIVRRVNFKYPDYLLDVCSQLPTTESLFLKGMWAKHCKRQNLEKVSCFSHTEFNQAVKPWHISNISNINDDFLLKSVHHFAGTETYPEITYAIKLKEDPELREIFCTLGYFIYAGLSDNEIAKKWRISPNKVKAVRLMFFDFAHFPSDRVARWAMLNQLKSVGLLDDVDHAFYKRIFDLGELGLKAHADYANLTDDEKGKIDRYLGNSMVSNTLNLHMSIKTKKDSIDYSRTVVEYARLGLEREDLQQRQIQTELVKLRMKEMTQRSGLDVELMTSEDKLLMDHVRELSMKDSQGVPYISISDLK